MIGILLSTYCINDDVSLGGCVAVGVHACQVARSGCLSLVGRDGGITAGSLQAQDTSPAAKDTQSHLHKERQLIAQEMVAAQPDQDKTEVFLAAAERGESTKVRKVRRDRKYGYHCAPGVTCW